eukprot:4178464-Prymnesium_polylepis.1
MHSGNGGQATLHEPKAKRTQQTRAHVAQGRIISKAQPPKNAAGTAKQKTKRGHRAHEGHERSDAERGGSATAHAA